MGGSHDHLPCLLYTSSDRTLPGLTNPIRSTMRETATSSLSLKHRLTFCPLSAFIRRIGRQEIILPWAAFRAKPLTVSFLNARTPEKCSSASVSYTHLDVYKRQAKRTMSWCRNSGRRQQSPNVKKVKVTSSMAFPLG